MIGGDVSIAEVVNQSSVFRNTFHLLKTAEKVVSQYMDERGTSGMFDERKYTLLVDQDGISSQVTMVDEVDVAIEEWYSTEKM